MSGWNVWRLGKALAAAGLACLFALGCYVGGLQLTGNFHEVVPGVLYRSAQPTPARLGAYHNRYGIKTVINLRGSQSNESWYDQELAESRQLGMEHIDFRMSARRDLSNDQVSELIRILRSAQRPVLIHCQAGADRSGLVSSIYLAAVLGMDEDRAGRQLSIRFGHFSLPWLKVYAMDRSWKRIETTPMLSRP